MQLQQIKHRSGGREEGKEGGREAVMGKKCIQRGVSRSRVKRALQHGLVSLDFSKGFLQKKVLNMLACILHAQLAKQNFSRLIHHLASLPCRPLSSKLHSPTSLLSGCAKPRSALLSLSLSLRATCFSLIGGAR